jgi:N6-adenosine-specific RNA methylase IME4/ParB-like chromosome segregation protein Spo0J
MPTTRKPATSASRVEVRPLADLREHDQAELIPAMRESEYLAFRDLIARHGILSPIEITPAGVVLDGRHRLRAARDLALNVIPVVAITPVDEVEHMLIRALAHRQLTPSQRAALTVELDQIRNRREHSRRRSQANLRRGHTVPEVATLPPRAGRTREHAAQLADVSPRTIQDALTVQQADPNLFQRVKAGEIAAHVAARRIRRAQRDHSLPPAPPLPTGPFDLIYADPPWQLGNPDGPHAPENHYPTLAPDQLKELEPPAAENALLYLWAVNCLLPQALELMGVWGFTYKTNLVWVKPSIGLGKWTRNRHELLLLGKHGTHPCPDPEDLPDSVIEAGRGAHSEKPEAAYELIEHAHPAASKLELFARGEPRAGWVIWGNQAEPEDEEPT